MDIQPYIDLYTRVFKYNNNDQAEREAEEREAQAQAEREAAEREAQAQAEREAQAQAEREAAEQKAQAEREAAERDAQAQADQGAQQGQVQSTANGVQQQSPDYIYYDMSKIKKLASIYATVSNNTQTISGNSLNIGDGYSYLDFKKNVKTGIIHFQRLDPKNGSLVNMEYDKTTKKLSAILPRKNYVFPFIGKEMQYVLNQLT